MDTNAKSSSSRWALWAALAMLAAGMLALLYVLFAASSKPEPSAGLARLAVGTMARLEFLAPPSAMPTAAIADAGGVSASLGDFAGEVLVVNLWATWCAPCIAEMPTLGALQRRFAGRIRVVAVSVDSAAKLEEAKAQLARLSQGSLPFYSDISRAILFELQAPGMPLTVIYGRDGRERARLAGGAEWDGEEAAALVEAVLAVD